MSLQRRVRIIRLNEEDFEGAPVWGPLGVGATRGVLGNPYPSIRLWALGSESNASGSKALGSERLAQQVDAASAMEPKNLVGEPVSKVEMPNSINEGYQTGWYLGHCSEKLAIHVGDPSFGLGPIWGLKLKTGWVELMAMFLLSARQMRHRSNRNGRLVRILP